MSTSRNSHAARPREPLAVRGIGCRLPGGIDSPQSFWQALLEGIDAICDVPRDRWDHSRFHDTNPEKSGYIRNTGHPEPVHDWNNTIESFHRRTATVRFE